MQTRRAVLRGLAATAAIGPTARTTLAFAAAPTEKRLAIVILRGGLDSLHAVPPYRERRYRGLRRSIAVAAPGEDGGALDLDGHFGLHPSLAPLHALFGKKQLLVIPAATTSYRDRSHFDGQNLLENGTGKPYGAQDGWLNRALLHLNAGDRRLGLSVGHAVPLLLRGGAQVATWSPTTLPKADDDFLQRLAYVYSNDRIFATALAAARQAPTVDPAKMKDMSGKTAKQETFAPLARAAGDLLSQPGGARIAVLEMEGWDTHFNQSRRLTQQLTQLAEGLEALRTALGAVWHQTAIAVVSEFGRTVAENGTGGTDHGVGGLALLLGGAVAGGKVGGSWPGLSDGALYQGRDLNPTTDYRAIFKGLLRDHIGMAEGVVEDTVFPASRAVRPLDGLVKAA